MENNYRIIKLHRPWASLPDFTALPVMKKPLQTPPNEAYEEEFTEGQLRSLALENRSDALAGLTVTEESLSDLPDDFFLMHYLHIRYRRPLSNDYYPLRADTLDGVSLSTSVHSLAGMVCMALVLSALMSKTAMSIDPAKIREARNLLWLLREVQFVIYSTLEKYPTANNDGLLVIGSFTELLRFQTALESTYWVLFDEDQLESYITAGNTIEQAIDHWVANKTQPQW